MPRAFTHRRLTVAAALLAAMTSAFAHAQDQAGASEFLIGPDDVLTVLVWRDKEMSGDVTVAPGGSITLRLVGEIPAAGRTAVALGAEIQKAAAKYLTDPKVTVIVRQINSRKIFITGEVLKPGEYQLNGRRTVVQLIALAGGLSEFAKTEEITILRQEQGGKTRTLKFNYKNVSRGQQLEQNVELQPGDTVVVP